MSTAATPRLRALAALVVFVVSLIVYTLSPVQQGTSDPRYTVLLSETLIHRRTMTLDASFQPPLDPTRYVSLRENGLPYQVVRDREGRVVLAYPLGTSILMAPAVAALNAIGIRTHRDDWSYEPAGEERAQRPLAALITAATAATMTITAARILTAPWALLVGLTGAFATMLWSTASRALWSDTTGLLLLALAIDRLVAWRDAAPTPAGAAILATLTAWAYIVRPTYILPGLLISGFIAIQYRSIALVYVAAGAAWAMGFVLWSQYCFGEWLPHYYRRGQELALDGFLTGLAGHLISPSRGLLVYMPWLVWVAAVLTLSMRHSRHRLLQVLALIAVSTFVVIHAFWPMWWGGHSYGPRLLTGLVPWFMLLLSIALAAVLESPRAVRVPALAAAALLIAATGFIHGRGALSKSGWEWNTIPESIDETPARLWNWNDWQVLAGMTPRPLPTGGSIEPGTKQSRLWLRGGWSHPEGNFRWTDGNLARVRWVSSPADAAATHLIIDGFPVERHPQRIVLTLNGTSLGEYSFPGGPLAVAIPAGTLRGKNTLEIGLPNAVRLDTGDPRTLAIGVGQIRLESRP